MLVCKQWARVGHPLLYRRNRTPQIPDEILLEILQYVRDTPYYQQRKLKTQSRPTHAQSSLQDLANCIQTCQRWHRVGLPLLYQHFVIDVNYHLERNVLDRAPNSFSRMIWPSHYEFVPSPRYWTRLWSESQLSWMRPWKNPDLCRWIQSVSVEIHFKFENAFQENLSITDVLEQLPNVRTFSLRAAPLRQGNYLSAYHLARIIEKIPSKIINFELDTQGRDISDVGNVRQRIVWCNAFSSLFCHLQSLRLRVSCLCPDFINEILTENSIAGAPSIDQPTFNLPLRSLAIQICSRTFQNPVSCCSENSWNISRRPPEAFVHRLQTFIEEHGFPQLRQCSIVTLKAPTAHYERYPRLVARRFDAGSKTWEEEIYVVDQFKGSHDYRAVGSLTDVRYQRQTGEEERYLRGPDFWDHWDPWLRHGQAADAAFEGGATWTQDCNGARHPPLAR